MDFSLHAHQQFFFLLAFADERLCLELVPVIIFPTLRCCYAKIVDFWTPFKVKWASKRPQIAQVAPQSIPFDVAALASSRSCQRLLLQRTPKAPQALIFDDLC